MSNFFEFIQKISKVVYKKKGQHVFQMGENDKNLYFVNKGLLKAYYLTENGKEFIKSFIQEQELIGSISSVYGQKKCSFSIVCLGEVELLQIPFNKLFAEAQSNNTVAMEVIDMLFKLCMKKENREYEFLCLSAKQRYLSLLKNSPGIDNVVTQTDIAKYLGITPVALSRIKNNS